MQVYDISANQGEPSNFELVDAEHFWEVPIDGEGPCEDPVPAADGKRYTPSSGAPAQGSSPSGVHIVEPTNTIGSNKKKL